MFTPFAKNLCEVLIASEFHFIVKPNGSHMISEDTDFLLLIKNQMPVLYIIGILNTNKIEIEEYEKQVKPFLNQIEWKLNTFNCNHVVVLNIATYEEDNIKLEIAQKELYLETKLFTVWWCVGLKNHEISTGKGHPDKILDIKEMVQNALKVESDSSIASFSRIENIAIEKSKRKVKSNNHFLTYFLIGINILVWVFMETTGNELGMIRDFANNGKAIFEKGEYFRLFTSLFLHVGFEHVSYNSLALYIFGTRAESYYGKFYYLLIYIISGLGGSIASGLFLNSYSVGASGAICGVMGSVLVLSGKKKKSVDGFDYFTILIFIVASIGFGFLNIDTDNYAHIGGFFVGFIYSLLISVGMKKRVYRYLGKSIDKEKK